MSEELSCIDTHAHVQMAEFDDDRKDVLRRCWDSGVCSIICPGVDIATSNLAEHLAQQETGVLAAIGVHPEDCAAAPSDYLAQLRTLFTQYRERTVAIGEILFDCVGWLLFLPAISALLFIGTKWGAAFRWGYLTALGFGLVLLLLGGARQGKGVGKALTALVNLYGIQSSYGVGSFLGDVLSYSRLLALGLTTAILASAFNMIAALIKFPAVGFFGNLLVRVVLGGMVLLFGHLLNYFMGTMGAFIHAARLILLEFFGRFYEGGAPRFHRFGFSSEVVKIVDKSTVQGKKEVGHGS